MISIPGFKCQFCGSQQAELMVDKRSGLVRCADTDECVTRAVPLMTDIAYPDA